MNKQITIPERPRFDFRSVFDQNNLEAETIRYRIGILLQFVLFLTSFFWKSTRKQQILFGIIAEAIFMVTFMRVDTRYLIGILSSYGFYCIRGFTGQFTIQRRY